MLTHFPHLNFSLILGIFFLNGLILFVNWYVSKLIFSSFWFCLDCCIYAVFMHILLSHCRLSVSFCCALVAGERERETENMHKLVQKLILDYLQVKPEGRQNWANPLNNNGTENICSSLVVFLSHCGSNLSRIHYTTPSYTLCLNRNFCGFSKLNFAYECPSFWFGRFPYCRAVWFSSQILPCCFSFTLCVFLLLVYILVVFSLCLYQFIMAVICEKTGYWLCCIFYT